MSFATLRKKVVKSAGLFLVSKLLWTVAAVVVLGLLLTASVSAAQSETPPIAYYASSECPTRSEFIAEISKRAKGAMGTTNPDLPPYVVEMGQNERGAFAIFQYRDATGNRVERSFRAASCSEVASAIALVIALALQGGKAREPEPKALQQQEQESNESDTRKDEAKEPADEPLDEAAGKGVNGFDWQIGASVIVDSLTIPGLLIKAEVSGGIVWDDKGSGVQAGFVRGESGVIKRNERSASFLLLGGRIEVCPLYILQISAVVVHPCIAVEMGSVQSSGEEGNTGRFRSETHEKFWSAGGPLLRFRATFYELLMEVHGGAWFPLIRETKKYVYSELEEDDISFYDIPSIGGTLGATIGYRF